MIAVLSDVLDWNEKGVDILGSVPIHGYDRSFVQFPLHHSTLRYGKSTLSTAMYVLSVPSDAYITLTTMPFPSYL